MKRLFTALLLISFLTPLHSFAKEFAFTSSTGDKITVSAVGIKATITLVQTRNVARRDEFIVWNKKESNGSYSGQNIVFREDFSLDPPFPKTKTFVIPNLTPNSPYYFKLGGKYYQFSTDQYKLTQRASSGQVRTVTFEYTTPLSDKREMFVLLSPNPPTDVLRDPDAWKKAVIPFSLGAAPATGPSSGDRTGTKEITIPPESSGGWFYPILAAKNADATYEVIEIKKTATQFGTESKIYSDPLEFSFTTTRAIIEGKIDSFRHPNFDDAKFTIQLETSQSAPFTIDTGTAGTPSDRKLHIPKKGTYGQYAWDIAIDPGTYYFRQTITAPSGKTDIQVGKFDTKNGQILPGSDLEANLFEKRSYRLLAPFPGLAVLLDPELCMEMLREGKKVPSICSEEDPSSFNGFLNYFFKLLIGLAAVLLVLRIIFEGYKYITTDIPFMKTNAKSNLLQALLGLGLALSAYLILNTINPKLVENTITIRGINLSIDLGEDLGHRNVVGAPAKLSSDVSGYGPFNITGDGVIVGDYMSRGTPIKIVNKIYPPEMEKGEIGKVKTIVLHNTMGSTAAGGWLEWVKPTNNSSCHFLIEKDGTVWQNARLTKSATCTGADAEWGIKKNNHIGIEVVGCANNIKTGEKCVLNGNPADLVLDPPTTQQIQSTIFLVNYLNEKFGTTFSNLVTTHGKVRARSGKKMLIEGQAIYDAIESFIIRK